MVNSVRNAYAGKINVIRSNRITQPGPLVVGCLVTSVAFLIGYVMRERKPRMLHRDVYSFGL
jgi:hypothetical protein